MKSTSGDKIIEKLRIMFARYGLPDELLSDNAENFIDSRLKVYLIENAIYEHHLTPYWPQANDEVERQNRSLLKRLKIAQATGVDWKLELQTYLFEYRTTPHTVTGVAPAELMFNRKIKSKIPDLTLIKTLYNDEEVRD